MLALFVVLTIAWRLVLAALSPIPSWDGVSYIWMAQRFAELDFAAGLEEVFPPGFSLLLAPLIACGLDPITAATAFGAVCAGLTLLPLHAIARREAPGGEVAMLVLWATASVLARTSAEILSEPPFLLAMAFGTLAGLRQRWWQVGIWSAIAFWIRPEGSLLAAAFVLQNRWPAVRALVPVALGVALLAWIRWLAGHGFDPLPIHEFHEHRDDLPDRGAFFANLLDVPEGWINAYGPVGVLALGGFWVVGRRRGSAFTWMVVLQIAVICTFIMRRRFLLSCAVPVFVWAAQAIAALRPRWRLGVLLAVAAFGIWHGPAGLSDDDRVAERRIGEYLGTLLEPRETVTGDLTRLVWFAGCRPLPPRRFDADRILAMAEPPNVRFVAIGTKRDTAAELEAGLRRRFVPLQLPPELEALAQQRGIQVHERR